jgi:hypothetical protein
MVTVKVSGPVTCESRRRSGTPARPEYGGLLLLQVELERAASSGVPSWKTMFGRSVMVKTV